MQEKIVSSFSKKSGKNKIFVESLWHEISSELISQGMKEEDKRFYPYLTTLLKKRLKITEQSTVLKRFKEFLREQTS